ncbi:MAG TPA: PQQ-binding-like beta-propeller repeat protein [Candidatus Kapabacteria bacterium]|nr:PQQ-binding-like beta-propeller repeat protein [Candidatus Kapabacteria bacterium]
MKNVTGVFVPPVLALPILAFALATGSPQHQILRDHSPETTTTSDSLSVDSALVHIDMDKAVLLKIPESRDMKPALFRTSDGRDGWAVQIPGWRPIATPAYADGMIFVGGGYGSYEFYAFDAATGKLAWQIKTADDGPTAAVVEDGYVAFNTESCTVIVVEAKTGKLVWQEWLGDPLMSQPAIANGRLFIAHPGNGRNQIQGHQHTGITPATLPPGSPGSDPIENEGSGTHHMLCADLRTGRHIWRTPIASDVISAPIVDSDKVYFTCFDGTSYALNAATGKVLWTRTNGGTSAPLIANGHVVMTTKEDRNGKTFEGMRRVDSREGRDHDSTMLAGGEARYLNDGGNGGVALQPQQLSSLDMAVGFSTTPESAQLDKAKKHIGVATVAGGWAYQGSRATYKGGQLMNAQGRYLNNVNAADGKMSWRAEARGTGIGDGTQLFSPPAVGGGNLYLCTALGHLAAVRQKDGAPQFLYRTEHPAAFQPALANGNMYVGTTDGWLICLRTGSSDADGWYAWGGNAQHNKKN